MSKYLLKKADKVFLFDVIGKYSRIYCVNDAVDNFVSDLETAKAAYAKAIKNKTPYKDLHHNDMASGLCFWMDSFCGGEYCVYSIISKATGDCGYIVPTGGSGKEHLQPRIDLINEFLEILQDGDK